MKNFERLNYIFNEIRKNYSPKIICFIKTLPLVYARIGITIIYLTFTLFSSKSYWASTSIVSSI